MALTRLDPYNVSEKRQIEEEIDNLLEIYKNEKIILVCDRFYFGISFINTLDKKGIKFKDRTK